MTSLRDAMTGPRLPFDLKGKRVTVVGLARSGFAASKLLAQLGARVLASDRETAARIPGNLQELLQRGVTIEVGGHRPESFFQADLIVISPGVTLRMPLLAEAKLRGIPVISEVELAFWTSQARFIGVTGTKGKGTTVTLLGQILERAGLRAVVSGNIGTPLSEVAPALGPEDWVVAELSSFQLEAIERFRPHVAILLNLAPDHLDRYAGLDEYYAAKVRLFMNQEASDYAVVNADDGKAYELTSKGRARCLLFSRLRPVDEGACLDRDSIVLVRSRGREVVCRASELQWPGAAMLENALAACTAASALGIEAGAMAGVLRAFRGREHCLEFVDQIGDVCYYDDSKATNVLAVSSALESFDTPIVLIAGGRDKGEDFRPLRPLVEKRVRALILLGEARMKIRAALEAYCPIEEASSMEEAVERARALARPGDVVLLSPGCASFDLFQNAEERGRRFKEAVLSLSDERAGNRRWNDPRTTRSSCRQS